MVETFHKLINQPIKIQKSPKLLSKRIRKRYYKTLGTSCPLPSWINILKFNPTKMKKKNVCWNEQTLLLWLVAWFYCLTVRVLLLVYYSFTYLSGKQQLVIPCFSLICQRYRRPRVGVNGNCLPPSNFEAPDFTPLKILTNTSDNPIKLLFYPPQDKKLGRPWSEKVF